MEDFYKLYPDTDTLIFYGIILALFISLLNKYFSGTRCNSQASLAGKVAIVTGANTGIGFETALDFARRGARVIVACRNEKKIKKAIEKLVLFSSNPKVELEYVDLADLSSVRQFCTRMNKQLDRLDILVNNAGVMVPPNTKTKDGFELQFGTNYLGPFLLTNLLLDLLKKTKDSRIVNVSSIAHKFCEMKWDNLNAEKGYSPAFAYCQSKLANILFTRELSNRLNGTSTTAYAVHPGVVRTEITRSTAYGIYSTFPFLKQIGYPFWYIMSKSAEEGAQTSIHCAVSSEALPYSGCYFSDCKVMVPSIPARDKEAARILWDISVKLVKL